MSGQTTTMTTMTAKKKQKPQNNWLTFFVWIQFCVKCADIGRNENVPLKKSRRTKKWSFHLSHLILRKKKPSIPIKHFISCQVFYSIAFLYVMTNVGLPTVREKGALTEFIWFVCFQQFIYIILFYFFLDS